MVPGAPGGIPAPRIPDALITMALSDLRQRTGYLFVAAVLGHVALISTQVNAGNGVPLVESVVFGVVTEVQRAAGAVAGASRRSWSRYVDLRGARTENEDLRRTLARVQLELQQQRALVDRLPGLVRLEDLRARLDLDTLPAEVIAAGASLDFRTLTIDRGTRDGVARDLAVIAPVGIVGRVVTPGRRAAKVQLLTDHNAAIGAVVERSRAQGVVMGVGEDLLRLDYVAETDDVAEGDVLLSSGLDGIYPKGFVIGRVQAVSRANGRFRQILVEPAVNFGSLEEVLVVLTPTPAADADLGSAP
jgi:rod shape-determining protein MreC